MGRPPPPEQLVLRLLVGTGTGAATDLGGQSQSPHPVSKWIILLDLRSFMTLLLKHKVDLFGY